MRFPVRHALVAPMFVSTSVMSSGLGSLIGAVGDVAKASNVSDQELQDAARQMMV